MALAASPGGRAYLVRVPLGGVAGAIDVEGIRYDGIMSSFSFRSDAELAAILNHVIHLAQYAGRVLVLTFVYTRCPVPEFCPLTLKHFRELDEALARDPALALRAHLLTISFDTAYDTPAGRGSR